MVHDSRADGYWRVGPHPSGVLIGVDIGGRTKAHIVVAQRGANWYVSGHSLCAEVE